MENKIISSEVEYYLKKKKKNNPQGISIASWQVGKCEGGFHMLQARPQGSLGLE
jgi:hypothetical protein